MKYLLLIYGIEAATADVDQVCKTPDSTAGHVGLQADLDARGVEWSAAYLGAPTAAKTLTKRSDGHSLHDGPFAETKEQLGGYYLIDVPGMDAALDWARKIPLADGRKVEIRPVL